MTTFHVLVRLALRRVVRLDVSMLGRALVGVVLRRVLAAGRFATSRGRVQAPLSRRAGVGA